MYAEPEKVQGSRVCEKAHTQQVWRERGGGQDGRGVLQQLYQGRQTSLHANGATKLDKQGPGGTKADEETN